MEKKDRKNSRGDEREGFERKRKMKESEETGNNNIAPLLLPNCKPISVGRHGDKTFASPKHPRKMV